MLLAVVFVKYQTSLLKTIFWQLGLYKPSTYELRASFTTDKI